jgi:hypothetical protein
VIGSAAAAAQVCNPAIPESTSTSSFIAVSDGTATDLQTGLMWKRCAEGQSWQVAGACTGTAAGYTWQGALQQASAAIFAGHTDWRLPNIKELRSLVEDRCHSPAINSTVFPGTPSSGFWSASVYANQPGDAWLVSFNVGDVYIDGVGGSFQPKQVRLVRALGTDSVFRK